MGMKIPIGEECDGVYAHQLGALSGSSACRKKRENLCVDRVVHLFLLPPSPSDQYMYKYVEDGPIWCTKKALNTMLGNFANIYAREIVFLSLVKILLNTNE